MLDRFSDLKNPIQKYLQYKEKVRILEAYIKDTIKSRVSNSKQEDLISLLVHLIGISKTEEEVEAEKILKAALKKAGLLRAAETEVRERREDTTSDKLSNQHKRI